MILTVKTKVTKTCEEVVVLQTYHCDGLCGATASTEKYRSPEGWETIFWPLAAKDELAAESARYLCSRVLKETGQTDVQPLVFCSLVCGVLYLNAALAMAWLTGHPTATPRSQRLEGWVRDRVLENMTGTIYVSGSYDEVFKRDK